MPDQRHILVVDDEPQITRVLRTSLSAQGYDIRVANSREMALEIMKDWQPNLIITDLSMPSIDGVELCRTVRAVSNFPIIVLSVRDKEQQKVEALDAGADDYVTKPFGMNELLARVRASLRSRAGGKCSGPGDRNRRLPHRYRGPQGQRPSSGSASHPERIRSARLHGTPSEKSYYPAASPRYLVTEPWVGHRLEPGE
jgi:two-component system KDP operon response regulator KdpE